MSAEILYYSLRGSEEKRLQHSIVMPGNLEATEFFGSKAGLVISCSIDNSSSTVTILGEDHVRKRIEATVWEDKKDMVGRKVELGEGRITVANPQELSLAFAKRRRKRPIKQIIIYFSSSEDGIREELPQKSEPLVLV